MIGDDFQYLIDLFAVSHAFSAVAGPIMRLIISIISCVQDTNSCNLLVLSTVIVMKFFSLFMPKIFSVRFLLIVDFS